MRQLRRRRVHDGWVQVDRLTLEDDGVPPSEWEVDVYADSVAVLTRTASSTSSRVAVSTGEDPVTGARRELREETGVVGSTARHLGSEWAAGNETRRAGRTEVSGSRPPGGPVG
ncbi:NUDIX domain-containing protein [Nocardioides anomalus]|uniref:NUDIX domain-containing protein n=1 Tax=Nocardioides anomalus TaxID=2712223 RepID=A0A6G6WGR2_9ACTN|nr:NUDIX domain-containing protein [Nocardioides anomalus]QIG44531.1 NUDIX domain-containing protein [Nocardioides anomalus]